ncbi:MAG: type I-C CRISPR-associated endonuclease Cas1c [Azospirillaceae bacterium]|nr:type I-C CRISPR-associated endonuclease Cas1c [Azospirillaceae bacterium]
MKRLLNVLFITTEGTYLGREGECLIARLDGQTRARVPISGLESVVCFGRVSVSPQALEHCAANGVAVSYFTEYGRFMARLEGPVSGSVLLRRTQYRSADDAVRSAALTRGFLTGKIANARHVLRRGAREVADETAQHALSGGADRLDNLLGRLEGAQSVDALRGLEGEAGRTYWAAFPALLAGGDPAITFTTRSRRPPLDPMNALLSFLYTILAHDIRGALEAAGFDPQVGYLHRDRPGRPSLALDMMEEFRSVVADRLAVTLVNRGQLRADDFEFQDGGGVVMRDDARKTVLTAWQDRKRDERQHPFLDEKAPIGMFWHLQALLLKRHFRGDVDGYPPCLWR